MRATDNNFSLLAAASLPRSGIGQREEGVERGSPTSGGRNGRGTFFPDRQGTLKRVVGSLSGGEKTDLNERARTVVLQREVQESTLIMEALVQANHHIN